MTEKGHASLQLPPTAASTTIDDDVHRHTSQDGGAWVWK